MRNDNDMDRGNGMSGTMMGLIAAIAVFSLLIMWAPWSGPNVANAPGTTVGPSTRPVTTVAPVAPAPTTPAAPTTTR